VHVIMFGVDFADLETGHRFHRCALPFLAACYCCWL